MGSRLSAVIPAYDRLIQPEEVFDGDIPDFEVGGVSTMHQAESPPHFFSDSIRAAAIGCERRLRNLSQPLTTLRFDGPLIVDTTFG